MNVIQNLSVEGGVTRKNIVGGSGGVGFVFEWGSQVV